MIIHWRAHVNSVQNAVGYMIKPTIGMMFAGAVVLQDVTLESATVVQPAITASVTQPGVTASVTQPTVTTSVKNDIS